MTLIESSTGQARFIPARPKQWCRFALRWLALCALILVFGWTVAPLLLVEQSGPRSAEAVVVLGGESRSRPARAAEVWRESGATWVLVSGSGDSSEVRRELIRAGVPEGTILLETESTSTLENARFSVPHLREKTVKEAIIVTSWYHSRRALHCFRHSAPDLVFHSRPVPRPAWSWSHPTTLELRRITSEYLKTIYYWLVHGVGP